MWQPIETAPKFPQKSILVANPEGLHNHLIKVDVAKWESRDVTYEYDKGTAFGWVSCISSRKVHPTHWQPLPEPPEVKP